MFKGILFSILFLFLALIAIKVRAQTSYTVTFDDLPAGYNLANYLHPKVRFSAPFPNTASVQNSFGYSFPISTPKFAVSSCGACYPYSGNLILDFTTPVRNVSVYMTANAYWSVKVAFHIYENNTYARTISTGNFSAGYYYYMNLAAYGNNITKIIMEPYDAYKTGVAFDNLSFTVNTFSPIGNFDSVSIEQAAALGWSLDPDNPSASNNVHCYIDNQFAGGVTANNPSPDVPYPGNHRFSLQIPIQYRDGINHQINCYGLDTGSDPVTLLNGSPKTFKFNAPIGWLDAVGSSLGENLEDLASDGNAVGWSMDTDAPRLSNSVHFYIDGPSGQGFFAGETVANLPRPDVNQQTGYIGNHGYEFSIPDQFRNGVQHTLYSYGVDLTGDQSKQLSGSPKTFTLNPRILSIELVPIDSALNINPNAGGGRRIFPDKQAPNEVNINRRKVLVKATILPAQANRMVYFKKYDLDDPSTDDAPVDNNGNQGNDNRGERDAQGNWTPQSAGTFNLIGSCVSNQNGIGCPTDANGVATIEFWTTMQPGDNFTVAVAVDPNYLNGIAINGIDLTDTNGNFISQTAYVPPARAKRSEMLTVWRKLHIEVDSMGNVGVGNNVQGTVIADGNKINPGNFNIQVTPPLQLEINRFENGRVDIGGNLYRVNLNNVNVIQIVVTTSIRIQNGTAFTLYDDDDYNWDDANSPDGDANEAILLLPNSFNYLSDSLAGDTSESRNVLSLAYILPEYQWAINSQYNQTNLQFELNVEDGADNATVIGVVNRNQDSVNSERDDFWVGYVLMGYQGPLVEDFDGYASDGTFNTARTGVSPGLSIVRSEVARCDCYMSSNCPYGGVLCEVNMQPKLPRGAFGSLIFQEVTQDFRRYFISPPPPIIPRDIEQIKLTVPHEIGHQFGCFGDQKRTTFKLMDYSNYINNIINEETFHPEHLNIMRWRIKSPGN